MRAQYLLAGEQPTLVTAQNAIRDIRNDSQPVPITVERIINEVARTMTVTPEDIRSTKRSAPISQARQVAAYVVRSITGLPMKAIEMCIRDRRQPGPVRLALLRLQGQGEGGGAHDQGKQENGHEIVAHKPVDKPEHIPQGYTDDIENGVHTSSMSFQSWSSESGGDGGLFRPFFSGTGS